MTIAAMAIDTDFGQSYPRLQGGTTPVAMKERESDDAVQIPACDWGTGRVTRLVRRGLRQQSRRQRRVDDSD